MQLSDTERNLESLADARIWTDKDGRTTLGRLVAVSESQIRLAVAGRLFTVSRCDLSPGDQSLLRSRAIREGVGVNDFDYLLLPGNSIRRTWTDVNGRQFDAELVAFFGSHLIFAKHGRIYRIPSDRFSAADRLATQQMRSGETMLARAGNPSGISH
jgi:hypothetical protein